MKVLWNDQIVERAEVFVDIEDRGYQYGDGLYEVIRVYQGKMFMAEEHLNRLWDGAAKIRLKLPFTQDELLTRLQQLMDAEGIAEGKIYFQVTRGIGAPRNHAFPDPDKVPAVLTANIQPMERLVAKQEHGVSVGLVADKRWLHCDIKSISLLGNILSLEEAKEKGFDDALLVRDDVITEASSSNFWMIKEDILYTHPDGSLVLPGITKMKVLQLARELELEVREEAFYTEDLAQATECFITSSTNEVVPVVKIDGKDVGNGKRGALTKKLQDAYIASTN